MAMATAGELIYSEEAKMELLNLIRRHTDKSLIEAVIADPSNHLRLEMEGHAQCLPGHKFYLVVVGKPPEQFKGFISNEEGEILEIYTYHISDY